MAQALSDACFESCLEVSCCLLDLNLQRGRGPNILVPVWTRLQERMHASAMCSHNPIYGNTTSDGSRVQRPQRGSMALQGESESRDKINGRLNRDEGRDARSHSCPLPQRPPCFAGEMRSLPSSLVPRARILFFYSHALPDEDRDQGTRAPTAAVRWAQSRRQITPCLGGVLVPWIHSIRAPLPDPHVLQTHRHD